MIDFIDTDKNGKINYSEFLTCCLESSLIQTELYLEYVFKELDQDKSGRISKEEIKKIFNEHQIQTDKNVEQIILECDKNNDGEIDYKEFLEAMGFKKWLLYLQIETGYGRKRIRGAAVKLYWIIMKF